MAKIEKNIPAVIYPTAINDPNDYLAVLEQEVVNNIYAIGRVGTNDDSTKLKAWHILFNKIRPDKTRLDIHIKSKAPYELIMKAIEENEDDDAKQED